MSLAVVCAYFNPCRYESRKRNYDVFRRSMERSGATLLTVELVFDESGSPELGGYGDVLAVRGGDVMWQKERLLQIGIEQLLADRYDAIAWVDADIVFETDAWRDKVLDALDRFDYVQSFDRLVSHYPEGQLARPGAAKDPRSWAQGGSWAGTLEFWRRVRLYQHCILGGGDTVMANLFLSPSDQQTCAFRWPEDNPVLTRINAAMREHIDSWAEQSRGAWRVGHVADQTAHLLPHGSRRHRYHLDRWQLLTTYDPGADVGVSGSGAFRWTTDKPQLHQAVRDFFAARREDDLPRQDLVG
jgi:hypothetical protein